MLIYWHEFVIAAQGPFMWSPFVSQLAFSRMDSDNNISLKLDESGQIFQTCQVCKSHYVMFCLLLWFLDNSFWTRETFPLSDCTGGLTTFTCLISWPGVRLSSGETGMSGATRELTPCFNAKDRFFVWNKRYLWLVKCKARQTLFKGECGHRCRPQHMGSCGGGGRDWAWLWFQQEQVGIHNQEAEWGSVDGKLLKGNRNKGDSCYIDLIEFFLQADQGGKIWIEGGHSSLNRPSSICAQTGFYKTREGSPRLGLIRKDSEGFNLNNGKRFCFWPDKTIVRDQGV